MRIRRKDGDNYRQCVMTALSKWEEKDSGLQKIIPRMEYDGKIVRVLMLRRPRSMHFLRLYLRISKGIWL